MANIVNIKKQQVGERNGLFAVYMQSDGQSGDLVNQTLISLADVNMVLPQRMRLEALQYNFSGFDAVIEFASGGVVPNYKWVLTEGTNFKVDFLYWGGLLDDSGLSGTGDLQITTTGFSSLGDQGSMLIKIIRA